MTISEKHMREAEELASKLELTWNGNNPPSKEHVKKAYSLNIPIIATALQVARDEAHNAALEQAAEAMYPMLRSMISRGEAQKAIRALKRPT